MDHPTSEFKSKSGLGRILKAMSYTWDGLKAAWQHEHAFRQELLLVVVGVCVALGLRISVMEKLVLIAVLLFVLVIELINSAIEAIVDRVSLERHPLSKRAKDLGSAAVFMAFLIAAAAWIAILINRFY
jgi:diacylglycerol kinase (ATP)